MYSFLHVLLLGGATLGIWMLRSRFVVALVCFLVLPLPAALFHLYVVPSPVTSLVEPLNTSAEDCGRQPSASSSETGTLPASEDAGEPAARDGEPKPHCSPASSNASRRLIFVAVVFVHYLVVLIGLFAAWLVQGRRTPKPIEGRQGPPRREPRETRRRNA